MPLVYLCVFLLNVIKEKLTSAGTSGRTLCTVLLCCCLFCCSVPVEMDPLALLKQRS